MPDVLDVAVVLDAAAVHRRAPSTGQGRCGGVLAEDQHPIGELGAPQRLRLTDLRRRGRAAGPGAERGRLRQADVAATSPNTAFIKLEEFTGVPDVVDMAVRLGMKSLATTPFVDPNTHRRTAVRSPRSPRTSGRPPSPSG
jgi:hypothetical protein